MSVRCHSACEEQNKQTKDYTSVIWNTLAGSKWNEPTLITRAWNWPELIYLVGGAYLGRNYTKLDTANEDDL